MYTASTRNKMKNTGMSTLLARSMPPPMPRAMTTKQITIATACQAVLPQAEETVPKKAEKPSTPSLESTEPVKAPITYFKSQPTTTE